MGGGVDIQCARHARVAAHVPQHHLFERVLEAWPGTDRGRGSGAGKGWKAVHVQDGGGLFGRRHRTVLSLVLVFVLIL
jgi:hypothetical protein